MFDEADTDKDGKLSYNEFIRLAEKHPDFITVLKGQFEGVSQQHAAAHKAKKDAKKNRAADKKGSKKE